MKRTHQQSSWGSSEHNEPVIHNVSTDQSSIESTNDSIQLDTLMETGFSREEAIRLSHLRNHLYDNVEVRQRLGHDNRLQFARWLFEHGEMHENLDTEPDQAQNLNDFPSTGTD
jgi:hypothetical protein